MTYAELIASLQDWVESTETALVAELDFIIELAEKRIYRSIDLNNARTEDATVTMTASVATVAVPTAVIILRSVQVVIANTRTALLQKDLSFLDDYTGNRTTEGTPRYYAWKDEATLQLAPIPNAAAAAGTITMEYTARPTQLSSSNTTTWLSLNAPDVLLYACLKEVATFQLAEPDIIQRYDQMYMEALQGLLMEENYRNRVDEYRNGEIRMKA